MPNSAGVEVARISVKVSPDTRAFRKELKADLEKIEKELRADVEVTGHLNDAQAKADFKRMMAQLKAEAAKGVRVPVDVAVDKKKGGVLGGLLGDGDDDRMSRATAQAKKLGGALSFLKKNPEPTWGSMLALIAALAAPLTGTVATLLAGLPSLIGAFGAGAGAVALGMEGIKAAAQTLAPSFEEMKTAVSAVFQQGLTPQFQQLLGLMPMVQEGMKGVASGMVDMFQGVTDAFATGAGPEQIKTFLANTQGLFSGLQGPMNTLTQGFLSLMTAGSSSFDNLTATIGNFSTGFNDMVNRVTASGALDSAFDGLQQVTDSLGNAFNELMELGINAMGQLGGPLSTFLGGLMDLFASLMPAFTSFSSLLGNVLGTLGTQLAPIVTALTPAFTTLADTLGTLLTGALQAVGPILTQVATLIGTTLNTALQALQPMLPSLLESFQQLSDVLVTSLAPHIPALGEALGQVAGAVLQLVPTIMQALIPAFVQLVPKFAELLPSVVSMAQSFAAIMPTVLPLAQALISVASAVIQVAVSIGGALIGALANLAEIIAGVVSKVAEWIASFANGAQEIAAKAAELPGMVRSALENLMDIGLQAGKDLVQGLINGIGGMISSAVNKAKELASSVAGAVKGFLGIESPSKLFEEYGKNTGQGFQIGLDKGFEPVLAQARHLADQVSAAFASGGDPTALLAGMSKSDVSRMEKVLGFETKRLEKQAKALEYQAKITGNEGLKAEAQRLRTMKEELSLQKDMLDLTNDFNDETDNGAGTLEKSIAKLMSTPVDFAKATGKQFLSDIGISGDGLISRAITEGIQYIFQIGSVDEALSIKDREESKAALSIVGR
ncbi:tape measure protein [Mycobacterium phage Journey13]|nr:tape measure protein [Mycobacterium phage Journey13]